MASIQWDQNTDFLDENIGTMDLNYELDENESNELLNMCLGNSSFVDISKQNKH
jgi:hypothetical protein